MKTNIYLLVLAALISTTEFAFAYNNKKCGKVFQTTLDGKNRASNQNWFEFILSGTTMGSSASATSYISSTGPCKAWGSIDNRRTQYIASNISYLRREAAQGEGEYLNALASLYGCGQSRTDFHSLMKNGHTDIFYGADASHVDLAIRQQMSDQPRLANLCTEAIN